MSVNWRYIHAVPMPSALTKMEASTAHVGKALKEMGSTVQVQSVCTVLQKCLERNPSNANTIVTTAMCPEYGAFIFWIGGSKVLCC